MSHNKSKKQRTKVEEYILTLEKYALAAIIAIVANYLIASFGGGDGQKCYIPIPGLPDGSLSLVVSTQCTPVDDSPDIIQEPPQADNCESGGGNCLPPQADNCESGGGNCLPPQADNCESGGGNCLPPQADNCESGGGNCLPPQA